MFSIVLQSNNEKLNKAYQDYLDAKQKLEECLYEEGIVVVAKKEETASSN